MNNSDFKHFIYIGERTSPDWENLKSCFNHDKENDFHVFQLNLDLPLVEYLKHLNSDSQFFVSNNVKSISFINILYHYYAMKIDKRKISIISNNPSKASHINELNLDYISNNNFLNTKKLLEYVKLKFDKKSNLYQEKFKKHQNKNSKTTHKEIRNDLAQEDYLFTMFHHKKFSDIARSAEGYLLEKSISPRSLTYIAGAFIELGKLSYAEDILNKANEKNSDDLLRLFFLAKIHTQKGEHKKVSNLVSKSLEIYSCFDDISQFLAILEFKLGNINISKKIIEESSNKSNTVASHFNEQGIKLVHQQKFQQALEHYTSAQYVLAGHEKGAKLFYNIALCYWKWGHSDQAKKFLQLAIVKQPNYEKAHNLLNDILQLKSA